jgi:hypothetical protein
MGAQDGIVIASAARDHGVCLKATMLMARAETNVPRFNRDDAAWSSSSPSIVY